MCMCLFVKVPSGATAPIKYKPMEVDAIKQVADVLMAGGVSVEKTSPRELKPYDHKLVSVVKANSCATARWVRKVM